MEFRRARNVEQKNIRTDQILTAANELFKVLEYKDITLGMIADKLDFSRANMSRYIESKEEIFLRLYIQDMQKLVNKLRKRKLVFLNLLPNLPKFVVLILYFCVLARF